MLDKVFIDSNIWLYALIETEDHELRHKKAKSFILDNLHPTVSTQVIREVSVNLLRKAMMPESEIRRLISNWYVDCQVVKTTESQFLVASYLRERHMLSFWDSLIIATALEANCTILYTEDMQHGLVIKDFLTLINPFVQNRVKPSETTHQAI